MNLMEEILMKKSILYKIFSCYILCLSMIFFISFNITPCIAYNDILNEVNIVVDIKEDGNAYFTETWITEVGSGTENYKVFQNMGDSKIKDFHVVDESGIQYEILDEWDINKSRREKTQKCGIIERNDSYELCWGVGNYGHREYTISYTITHFVQQYLHDQGFNYAFLSNMDLPPQKVKVEISSFVDFTDEFCDIYAFGYSGKVEFIDGNVVLQTDTALSRYSKVQLLMRIDDGTYINVYDNEEDFVDILEEAKIGSDYDDTYEEDDIYKKNHKKTVLMMIATLVITFSMLFFSIFLTSYQVRKKKKKENTLLFNDGSTINSRKKLKNINMFRDIPCHKDLYYFYYTSLKAGLITSKEKSGIITTILLSWIKDRQIEFIKTKDQGLLFKKEGYSIDLNKNIVTKNIVEEELLKMLRKAAGNNGILETNEFEKWCKVHYSIVDIWFDRVESFVESWMISQGLLDKKRIPHKFLFITNYTLERTYNIQFKEAIYQVAGFKKFLKEMSIINEKEVIDVKLWEDYLLFATILGIADEVEKQLKINCPQFNEGSYMDTVHTTRIMRDFTHRSVAAAYRAQTSASHSGSSRSSGGGGRSSSHGGGSRSSGGGGGGRR